MRWVYLFIIATALFSFDNIKAHGQQGTGVRVNFVHAFQLGFGSHDIGGLDVRVIKLPISYTFDLPKYERLKMKL